MQTTMKDNISPRDVAIARAPPGLDWSAASRLSWFTVGEFACRGGSTRAARIAAVAKSRCRYLLRTSLRRSIQVKAAAG
eukprot:scaffold1408_cov116-Isochrysis_galbana.AAC.2